MQKKAAHWYRLAAEQGYVQAQYNLAVLYRKGKGVMEDANAAHMWYNIAAADGDQFAWHARDRLEKTMTPEQIVQTIQKAKTCLSSNYANCD